MEPEENTEPIPDLFAEQHRRAMALSIAKPLLTRNGFATTAPPTVEDLITLADYILFGTRETGIMDFTAELSDSGDTTDEGPYANEDGPLNFPDSFDAEFQRKIKDTPQE